MATQATTVTQGTEDYSKIYWVEAFSAIMDQKTLEKDKFFFYSRVLISHTLANGILKDQQISTPDYQTQQIETFYESYKEANTDKNSLLSKVFMTTLIDIDPSKLKLGPKDKEYIENYALKLALKAKNFTHFLDDGEKKKWMLTYMFAKTQPKDIDGNVELYKGLGLEKYNQLVALEMSISSGSKCVPEGTTDIFTEGWYTLYGKSLFPLEKVIKLKTIMEDPFSYNLHVDPRVGHIYFKYRLVQETVPQDLRQTYWKTKISNISTFIAQVSNTDKIAAQNK